MTYDCLPHQVRSAESAAELRELRAKRAAELFELSTQFVGGGDPSRPLDAVSEIVRETGRMLFLRGFATQPRADGGENIIASYSGIVRKMRSRD